MPRARTIARVSASGAARCAITPLAIALQLAMVGRASSAAAQGAFGLCACVVSAMTIGFNFLSDGVVADVGARLGAGDRMRAGAAARLALTCALVGGAGALGVALGAGGTALDALGVAADVKRSARAYYGFRALGIPMQCAWSCMIGVVSGGGRVGTATVASAAAAAAETAVVAAATAGGGEATVILRRAGIGYVVVVGLEAVAAVVMIVTVVPRGERAPLPVRSAPALRAAEVFDFLRNGASMAVRSLLLQASFVLATLVAARNFDAHGLAAHHIVVTLWMLCAYVVDGFAVAANVIGSRLFGCGRREDLVKLSHVLLACGVATGFAFSIALDMGRSFIPQLFTADEETKTALLGRSNVWSILVISQPINAACFVYDGFIYATQSFSYIREIMASGVGLVFLPVLFLTNRPTVTLAGIWKAKLALNIWRVVWLAARVHLWLPRQQLHRSEITDDGDDDDDVSLDLNDESSDDATYREPLLPNAEPSDEDDLEAATTSTPLPPPHAPSTTTPQTRTPGVSYESSLKPSKIKSNLSPIRTPELALARASNLNAHAGAFVPPASGRAHSNDV